MQEKVGRVIGDVETGGLIRGERGQRGVGVELGDLRNRVAQFPL